MNYIINGRDLYKEWNEHVIGFEEMCAKIYRSTHSDVSKGFPPYSISNPEENKYVIEMAVAGFGKQDIEVNLTGDVLSVQGKFAKSQMTPTPYLYKGIANREFSRNFTVLDGVTVHGASMVNGMLKIFLERLVPESKKARKIEIADEADSVSVFAAGNPQLLNEEDRNAADGKLM